MTALLWMDKVKEKAATKAKEPPKRTGPARAAETYGRTFPWAIKTQKKTTKGEGPIIACELCGVPTTPQERIWVNTWNIKEKRLERAGVDWKPTHFLVCRARCARRLEKMGGYLDEGDDD